jgi:hypothetical protein
MEWFSSASEDRLFGLVQVFGFSELLDPVLSIFRTSLKVSLIYITGCYALLEYGNKGEAAAYGYR